MYDDDSGFVLYLIPVVFILILIGTHISIKNADKERAYKAQIKEQEEIIQTLEKSQTETEIKTETKTFEEKYGLTKYKEVKPLTAEQMESIEVDPNMFDKNFTKQDIISAKEAVGEYIRENRLGIETMNLTYIPDEDVKYTENFYRETNDMEVDPTRLLFLISDINILKGNRVGYPPNQRIYDFMWHLYNDEDEGWIVFNYGK